MTMARENTRNESRMAAPGMEPSLDDLVAVVVAGAGARGGYEAGVLSVLVPRLRAAGHVPMFVGTSAGAINATLFAAFAHLSPDDQAEAALDVWRDMSVSNVFRSPVLTSWLTALRGLGQILRVPGVRLTGLLDTTPLTRLADRVIDWDRLHQNIDEGLTSLAVVTTSGSDNRTVVFVDRVGGEVPPPDDDRPIDYVPARILPAHVLASSAIPVVFPPVEISGPTGSAWYLDGGVRLNAPMKPALSLGADAIAVVATHPQVGDDPTVQAGAGGALAQADAPAPDIDDTLVRLIDAALVDRMVEDLRHLSKLNAEYEANGTAEAREKIVPFLALAPATRGTIGELAARVYKTNRSSSSGSGWPRWAELRALGFLMRGSGPRSGDLLSYLYFERAFVEASIEQGRQDAETALRAVDGRLPWQTHPVQHGELSRVA